MITTLLIAAENREWVHRALLVLRAQPRGATLLGGVLREVASAAPEPEDLAVPVMNETLPACDLMITLGPPPSSGWPLAPGIAPVVHWPAPGSADELLGRWRALHESGVVESLSTAGSRLLWMLDRMPDAVIVHDASRRVVYLNGAAERLMGVTRAGVLGRDCHQLFPGHLCGGQCLFQNEAPMRVEQRAEEFDIVRSDGERRRVACLAHPMTADAGTVTGVLLTLKDISTEHELARQARVAPDFAGIVGSDPRMREVFEMIRDLADTTAPVLIQGESGTGKELVAAAIHTQGLRAARPFVAVNCGALPETLLESELFGHVRGAFTGAIRDKKGRFELADGGTIFLDEIGDIAPAVQVKLLRVLQEGRFERVGSEQTLQVDVRVISATNKVLAREIAAGRFREDLFYRLSVVPLHLPPLRERRGDIPALARHLLDRLAGQLGYSTVKLSDAALEVMLAHAWPGNVREMQNWLHYALVRGHGQAIEPRHFPPGAGGPPPAAQDPHTVMLSRQGRLTRDTVRSALAACQGNRQSAARLLGVSRATIYRYLDKTTPTLDGAEKGGPPVS